MKHYRKEQVFVEELRAITCDVCKTEYSYFDDPLEFQEILSIKTTGGFGSIFGDMNDIELDICQHCFKDNLGEYIRINEEDDDFPEINARSLV